MDPFAADADEKYFRGSDALKSLIIFLCLWCSGILAHEGPAFPVLVNHSLKTGSVSVWADPDTGNGTYQLYIKPIHEGIESISVTSFPLREKGHQLTGTAQKLANTAGQQNYMAIVPFDSEETWESEFTVKQKDGTAEIVRVQVDVTPPGPSKWEFALYFLPFLLIGFIWGKAYFMKKI